jgi:hypothetical protein
MLVLELPELKSAIGELRKSLLEEKALLLRDLALSLKGRVIQKKINGKVYYYLLYRKSPQKVFTDYIPLKLLEEVHSLSEKHRLLKQRLREINRKQRALKMEKDLDVLAFLREILDVFVENGLFEEGFLLVGSFVQRLYSEAFDVSLPLFSTMDADFAVERPYRGKEFPLISEFEKRGFEIIFLPNGAIRLKKGLFRVDFLTPSVRGEERPVRVPKLELVLQALNHLRILFSSPIWLEIPSILPGGRILVPHPADFVIHKILVAYRRREKEKSQKDLDQARWVFGNIVKPHYRESFELKVQRLPRRQQSLINEILKTFD